MASCHRDIEGTCFSKIEWQVIAEAEERVRFQGETLKVARHHAGKKLDPEYARSQKCRDFEASLKAQNFESEEKTIAPSPCRSNTRTFAAPKTLEPRRQTVSLSAGEKERMDDIEKLSDGLPKAGREKLPQGESYPQLSQGQGNNQVNEAVIIALAQIVASQRTLKLPRGFTQEKQFRHK